MSKPSTKEQQKTPRSVECIPVNPAPPASPAPTHVLVPLNVRDALVEEFLNVIQALRNAPPVTVTPKKPGTSAGIIPPGS